MTWQLQNAKNQFSEVVTRALSEGPQTVTRRGKEVVVVLSMEDYRRLVNPAMSFKAFLRCAPIEDLEIERSRDDGREVELP